MEGGAKTCPLLSFGAFTFNISKKVLFSSSMHNCGKGAGKGRCRSVRQQHLWLSGTISPHRKHVLPCRLAFSSAIYRQGGFGLGEARPGRRPSSPVRQPQRVLLTLDSTCSRGCLSAHIKKREGDKIQPPWSNGAGHFFNLSLPDERTLCWM